MSQQSTESIKPVEDWMAKKWRPMMGWTYMLICFLDMAVFPVLWSALQGILHQSITQWNPLTLQGAGLFHISMGAVLGIAAYGRTQEKMAGATTASTTVASAPAPVVSAPAPGFGPATGFTPAPAPSVAPAPSFGSKPIGPAAAAQPEL
jgi:hypothetical protein